MSLFKAIMELTAAIKAGAGLEVYLEKFKAVLDIAFGPVAMQATPGESVKDAIAECQAACAERIAVASTEPEVVGKIGDGVLLKIILEALIKFAPLFI